MSMMRGIQKICGSCEELGTPMPEYTLLSDDLTVRFSALERFFICDFEAPKRRIEWWIGG